MDRQIFDMYIISKPMNLHLEHDKHQNEGPLQKKIKTKDKTNS